MSATVQSLSDSTRQTFREALAEQHISVASDKLIKTSSVNIVIGSNGAGKTRFLKAVKNKYRKDGDKDILYGYFPSLSPDGSGVDPNALPEFSLEEFLDNDYVSFNDFFKEIESQHSSFFKGFLQPVSANKQKKYDRLLKAVSDTFSSFTGKTVSKGDATIAKLLLSSKKSETYTRPAILVEDPLRGEPLPLEQALSEFSPGERTLFYMSLFFALKKQPAGKRMQVIILDEPEAHLHPDALIKFVTGLTAQFPKAKIWIATHSLVLLPLFKFENIFYVENSTVFPRSSDLYTRIFSSMLGSHGEDIQRFFASLPQWQYCDFIAECFTDPEVISTINPADPQVDIFIQTLQSNKPKKVLDYGGGSGRLGRSVEAAKVHEWKNVEYHILDKEKQVVGGGIKVTTDLKDADSDYDCVVMMNFLHEVDPSEWAKMLSNLYPRISPDGCLLFVEVEALQNGEYPNDAGYFLLGPEELKTLFYLNTEPTVIVDRNKGKHRGFLIPRGALQAINDGSVAVAIKKLESRTYNEIKNLRAKGEDQSKSRQYAFLLQQHMNAMLYNEKQAEHAKAMNLTRKNAW